MNKFIESLRRLYKFKRLITVDKINELLSSDKINHEEYDYIVSD